MVFDNVVAESGGGRLAIGGTVAYGEGPLTYALNAHSDQVRIRYPVGMSWLVGGTLRLSGNTEAATLSGRIVVDRLLMAEGFDLEAFAVSATGAGQWTKHHFPISAKFAVRYSGRYPVPIHGWNGPGRAC